MAMLSNARSLYLVPERCQSPVGHIRQELVCGQPTPVKYLTSGRKLPLALLPVGLLKPRHPSQNGGHGQAAFDNMRDDIIVQNC